MRLVLEPPALLAASVEVAEAVRWQQTFHLVVAFVAPALATLPWLRAYLVSRARRVLAAIVVLDLCYMIWATLPYVPLGVDETFFLINSRVYRGSDLFLLPNRPPLPSLCAALFPWHPPLVGLLLRSASALTAYFLAERAFGPFWALLTAWLTLFSARLTEFSVCLLSEPYGAAFLTCFALGAARGMGASLGLLAALAFLSRWPLGWLLPVAIYLGWRRERLRGAGFALVLFVVPVISVLTLTHADPLGMIADRGEWKRPILATAAYYLSPKVGYGLGYPALLLVAYGAWRCVRSRNRRREVVWCLLLFTLCAGALTLMGEATARFMAPAVPIGSVLVVAGLRELVGLARDDGAVAREVAGRDAAARKTAPMPVSPDAAIPAKGLPRVRTHAAVFGGLLIGAVVMLMAIPVRPPKARQQRITSRQYVLATHREALRNLIGRDALYSDFHFIAVTAVLGVRCHAVLPAEHGAAPPDPARGHPVGVGLDLDGRNPPCPRERVPAGALYLTYDAGGRSVLWQAGDLHLVRW